MTGFWGSVCHLIIIVTIRFVDVEAKFESKRYAHSTIDNFPWHAALCIFDEFSGDATIISQQHILTSARLVYEYASAEKLNSISIIVGENPPHNGIRETHAVQAVVIRPDYEHEFPFINDLAILKLRTAIQFTDTKRAIQLPTQDISARRLLALSGSGISSGYVSDRLKIFLTKTEGNAECGALLRFHHSHQESLSTARLFDTQLCTVASPSDDCLHQGNVGGPLTDRNILYGIKSWDTSCFSGDPVIYSRIFKYVDWINETMAYL